jgi:hypothetical protein
VDLCAIQFWTKEGVLADMDSCIPPLPCVIRIALKRQMAAGPRLQSSLDKVPQHHTTPHHTIPHHTTPHHTHHTTPHHHHTTTTTTTPHHTLFKPFCLISSQNFVQGWCARLSLGHGRLSEAKGKVQRSSTSRQKDILMSHVTSLQV